MHSALQEARDASTQGAQARKDTQGGDAVRGDRVPRRGLRGGGVPSVGWQV